MSTRLDDVPVMKSQTVLIEAKRYNQIRLALLRLGNPLRFEIPNLRGIDILLDDKAWACVDRTLHDFPVLAWIEFHKKRSTLHEPISSKLLYYHLHAHLIVDTVYRAMDKTISTYLAEINPITSFQPVIRQFRLCK